MSGTDGTLDWQPTPDEDRVAFEADFITFQACLDDYTPPTERPGQDAPKLDYLRWMCARRAQTHPEIDWRIWTHPQDPEKFWLGIGHGGSMVDSHDAHERILAADDALLAYKWAIRHPDGRC